MSLKTDVLFACSSYDCVQGSQGSKFQILSQLVMLKMLLRCKLHAVSLSAVVGEKYVFRRH